MVYNLSRIILGELTLKVYYSTFGCKVNQCETENIKQSLEKLGFQTVTKVTESQICIVNSCTVTSQSDLKCRQVIHHIKKDNPDCTVLLRGCLPQAFPNEAMDLYDKGYCDIIVGNKSIKDTVDAVLKNSKNKQRFFSITKHQKNDCFDLFSNNEFCDKTRAYIKIQDGCEQYCTYCIIPYARGFNRSKPLSEIKREVQSLAKSGHKEVILVGINLCCYGKDLGENIRLIDAIEAACSVEEVERVRLGSIEPELLLDSDIERMSKLKKLCPQFHLSLQSGCNKTLKAMNRKYTSDDYLNICLKLREAFPDCSITTDIMVGFPEESDEDFKESLEFVEKIGFADAHIFPYSKRVGTIASKKEQINGTIKKQRAQKMKAVCDKSRAEFLKNMVGKRVNVLFEKENCTTFHQGYSENYTLIKIRRENIKNSLKRKSFYVIIEEVDDGFCIGRICHDIVN